HDIEAVEGPEKTLGGTDLRGNRLNLDARGLAQRRRCDSVELAFLIGRDQPPFRVYAQIHPRALRLGRDGVEELDVEVFLHLDERDRRGAGLGASFFFLAHGRGMVGQQDGDKRDDGERESAERRHVWLLGVMRWQEGGGKTLAGASGSFGWRQNLQLGFLDE